MNNKKMPDLPTAKDVLNRNTFYSDSKPKVMLIMITGVMCAAVGIATLMYAASKKENNVYIATNESGSILKLVPLSQPNQKSSVVSNWVGEALIDTFDFSYYNLNDRLNKSTMKWFTKDGGQKLLTTLQDTGNLDVIKNKELFVSLALKHTPLIVKEAKPTWSNSYIWKVEVEAIITYRTKTSVYTNDVVFAVLVTRRSNLEDAKGLGISSIIMTKKQ
jgi:intracellular multiplication protein IcmL